MAGKTIGSALEIPQSALDSIQKAEDRLRALQSQASKTAGEVKASFGRMAVSTDQFIAKLDLIIQKLNLVSTATATANSATSGFGQQNVGGIQNFVQAIQQAIANINQMSASLQAGGNTGASAVMVARQAVQDLVTAIKNASGMNIAGLRGEIDAINKKLRDSSQNLTKADQDALNEKKKLLQEELKEQERTADQRAATYAKAVDRMLAAEGRFQNRQKKAQAQQEHANNTTYTGALSYSGSAKTLNEHAQAIKNLTEARGKLDTTDSAYKSKLEALNTAIAKHKKVLQEAGVQARQLAEEHSYLAGYAQRLAQRMAVVFTLNTAKNFIDQIVEIRGQFEMSQRSLESVLQDKPKADEIFQKTVELAIKSPFQIKDLVSYTRQLSAYRIESDKLYETTKRLADVGAGLGVDMGRLILAYGQIKAASYLRGSEVRQLTEAGINVYGELQSYFKEVKGEAYTTAEIVDMISKRMVSFEDVEAVFKRLTSEGGLFYNMQEEQSETLQGRIANLADSFDVMYNAIGKEHEGMLKGGVSFATSLLDHWEEIGTAIQGVILLLAQMKLWTIANGTSLANVFNANFVAVPLRGASAFGVLRNMLVNVANAAKTVGGMISASVKATLPLLAAAAALKAVWDIGTAIYDTQKKMAAAAEETVRLTSEVTKLNTAYSRLKDTEAGIKKGGVSASEEEDMAQNIEDRRTQIEKLIDVAGKNGLKIDIDVSTIDEAQLDQTFATVLAKYKSFIAELEVVKKSYAKNDNWNTWFTDGLGDDAEDYKGAVVGFLSQDEKIRRSVVEFQSHYKEIEAMIARIQATSPKLAQSMQAAFDAINTRQGDKEEDAAYLERVYKAMLQINMQTYTSSWGKALAGDLQDVGGEWRSMERAAAELESEFDAVFENLSEKTKKDPVQMKAIIDNVAAEKEWNQFARALAYRKFGIKVNIDEAEAQSQVSWLDNYLKNFFARKNYKINLVANEITDENAMDKFIGKGDTAAKAAKNWAEVEKRLTAISRKTKEISLKDTNYDDIKKLFKNGDIPMMQERVSVGTLIKKAREYKNAATETAREALGVDPFASASNKAAKQRSKQERDILNERIQLYKDMASKYKELQEIMGQQEALTKTREYFASAAKVAGVDISTFVPDKAAVVAKIKELAVKYKELTKRGGAFRTAADLEIDLDKEKAKASLERIKTEIEELFSQRDLHIKLTSLGFDEDNIQKMFGVLPYSWESIRSSIEERYAGSFGADKSKWGTDITKQYEGEVKSLDQKIYNDQVSQLQELTKAYKQQLSDNLQLYVWYLGEKKKIMENAQLAQEPEMQQQYLANLESQYNKKQQENAWKDFKGGGLYVSVFENMEGASTRILNYMLEKLRSLKDSMKELDPSELKTITEQIQKIQEAKAGRNPLGAFVSGLNQMIKARKEYARLGGDKALVKADKADTAAGQEVMEQERLTRAAKETYNNLLQVKGARGAETIAAKQTYEEQNKLLQAAKNTKTATAATSKALQNAQGNAQTATAGFDTTLSKIGSGISELSSALSSFYSSLGGSSEEVEEAFNIAGSIGSTISNLQTGNLMGVASSAFSIAGSIAKLFNSDKKYQKQIEKQQRNVEKLQRAYEKFKDAIDDAWDSSSLLRYNDTAEETIQKQITSYEAMIKAEKSKKNSDKDKITEYQNAIEDLEDTLKELAENQEEALGGFGSEANYKAAAEAFTEAWVDAFGEGEDTLAALEEQFDEYFDNMLKKQLTNRAAGKFLTPILEAFDKAVSEGSEGGNGGTDVTANELANLRKLKEENLAAYDAYLKNLTEILNVSAADVSSSGSSLSGLQKGIQSVTESTAEALESILNSVRYYLAMQQADVRVIRDTLLNGSYAGDGGANPSTQMLSVLREQASYVRQIASTLSDVTKGGHSQGGKGLKVFMQ